jgi:hypothetical protein
VSAVAAGGNLNVEAGSVLGGSFRHSRSAPPGRRRDASLPTRPSPVNAPSIERAWVERRVGARPPRASRWPASPRRLSTTAQAPLLSSFLSFLPPVFSTFRSPGLLHTPSGSPAGFLGGQALRTAALGSPDPGPQVARGRVLVGSCEPQRAPSWPKDRCGGMGGAVDTAPDERRYPYEVHAGQDIAGRIAQRRLLRGVARRLGSPFGRFHRRFDGVPERQHDSHRLERVHVARVLLDHAAFRLRGLLGKRPSLPPHGRCGSLGVRVLGFGFLIEHRHDGLNGSGAGGRSSGADEGRPHAPVLFGRRRGPVAPGVVAAQGAEED